MPPIAGLRFSLDYYKLVLFVTLNFQIKFETVNLPGFEPESPGPKAAMLTVSYTQLTVTQKALKNSSLTKEKVILVPSLNVDKHFLK